MANDKYSLKNLLFSKPMPNYVIPTLTSGHKIYTCSDCGDRFLFESSYDTHINRKSVRITFKCQHCRKPLIFNNRCRLLQHIRSHVFKTATINLTDLQVQPIEVCDLPKVSIPKGRITKPQTSLSKQKPPNQTCFDCKQKIIGNESFYLDRAKHYMNYNISGIMFTCPICMFVLPTMCGLKTHLRIHFKKTPFICPECGITLKSQCITYPYNHDCEGFKMMRVTARLKCPVELCNVFHPSKLDDHMKEKHLITVYRCPKCVVACFTLPSVKKHMQETHSIDIPPTIYYQCQLCPGRLVITGQLKKHLLQHVASFVYPCWSCGKVFSTAEKLVSHSQNNCPKTKLDTDLALVQINSDSTEKDNVNNASPNDSVMYQVIKRCDQCKNNFTYSCNSDEISKLPNNCPIGCTTDKLTVVKKKNIEKSKITCGMCKRNIEIHWGKVKKHYATHHKEHKCLDVQVRLQRIDKRLIMKKLKRKTGKNLSSKSIKKSKVLTNKHIELQNKESNVKDKLTSFDTANKNNVDCKICNEKFKNVAEFQEHIINHRDPYTAYQCLECGMCFVVKPSFSTHLMIVHNILDVEEYIKNQKCFNEEALRKQKPSDPIDNTPILENQCKICRDQFENTEDLEKHFRVHGMAFLMTKTLNRMS